MPGEPCTTILISTSQPATRSALRIFLGEEPGFEVAGEAHDSHELLKKIESTRPDVVLLEWDMLDRAAPILVRTICEMNPELSLIILSANSDHQEQALSAGADAFLNISDSPRELLTAIRNIRSQTTETVRKEE